MAGPVVEIVKQTLDAIEHRNGNLNAFVKVMRDGALAEAEQLERKTEGAVELGPLHGVPIAVKDIIDVAGEVTGCGSLTRRGAAPAVHDAHVVAKLREAGAVIAGKTNTVEYALGGYGTNVTIGTPRNPWDLRTHRVPGGSSSGSGVAVGAGLVPAALGTDTGGSVRIPSALCGCVGLKTSIGFVGRTGVAPLSVRLDTVGPMARDVRTTATMLSVMIGPDPEDRSTGHDRHIRPQDVLDRLEDGVAGMRLGRLDDRELPLASDEVRADYRHALGMFEELGARVAVCKLPERLEGYQSAVGKIASLEGYGFYKELVDNPHSGLAEPVRQRMLAGKGITAAQIEELDARRRRDLGAVQSIFEGFDAIVLPTVPFPAMPVVEVDETTAPYAAYTRWVNYLDVAGLAVPSALSKAGLPMSLQIVVRRFDDPLALRIGRAFEKARGEFPRPPA
ncbi:MAG: amidase [Hyphomicrobiaceae bacterium]|jgi:aspartyl-tRNA(Asn)/glutamyl-tRNA(Gln) amidotransferase subunit A